MNKEHSLEEDVRHGTEKQPLAVMYFEAGAGTWYPDGFFVQRHWHKEIEVIRVRKGSYRAELNLENITLEEGDFCFVNSEELHEIVGNTPDTLHEVVIFHPQILEFAYSDEFQESVIAPLVSHANSLSHVIHRGERGYDEIEKQFQRITELDAENKKTGYYGEKICLLEMIRILWQEGYLVSSSSVQTAAEKEKADRYKRVVSYMEEHYAEQVSLQDLADTAGCNPQYLCRVFRDIAGVPPIRYLIRYRIERAKELLDNSTENILEISMDCGFENVSYFIRQFKRETGTTPREYRRRLST